MNKIFLIFTLALSTLLFSGCSMFREQLTESDLSVAELEVLTQKVTDPNGQFKNAKSYYQKQIITDKGIFSDRKYIIISQFMAPDKRIQTTFDNGKPVSSLVITNDDAFSVDYNKKEVNDLPENLAKMSKSISKISETGSSYSTMFPKVEAFRKEVDGTNFYLIRCSNAEGKKMLDVYVDPESYLPNTIEYIDVNGNKNVSTILEYTKNTNVILPLKFSFRNGSTGGEQEIEMVDFFLDNKVDPAIFQKPVFSK